MRATFEDHLPHASTLQAWYRNSNLNVKSGISENPVNVLKQVSNEMAEKHQQLLCCLSFDEMAIRKHYQWCNKSKKFIGNVTYGQNLEEIANIAIVYLISELNAPCAIC